MPNHCSNLVNVTGPRLLVHQFMEAAISADKKSALSFQSLVPMPAELEGTDGMSDPTLPKSKELIAKYGAADWYAWHTQNWSTKWDCYDVGEWEQLRLSAEECKAPDAIYRNRKMAVNYTTAWCPASELWKKVSKQHPKLTFTHYFCEPGMAFVGFETFVNGELFAEANYDWDSGPGKNLRAEFGFDED